MQQAVVGPPTAYRNIVGGADSDDHNM
jgi:hypothetical protein